MKEKIETLKVKKEYFNNAELTLKVNKPEIDVNYETNLISNFQKQHGNIMDWDEQTCKKFNNIDKHNPNVNRCIRCHHRIYLKNNVWHHYNAWIQDHFATFHEKEIFKPSNLKDEQIYTTKHNVKETHWSIWILLFIGIILVIYSFVK